MQTCTDGERTPCMYVRTYVCTYVHTYCGLGAHAYIYSHFMFPLSVDTLQYEELESKLRPIFMEARYVRTYVCMYVCMYVLSV